MPSRLILVVDDDRAMCDMLVEQLQEAGFGAASAASVDEAMRRLRAESFTAVLSDVAMEPRDGFSLLEELRAWGEAPPVVLMSSLGRHTLAQRAAAAGARAILAKPFRSCELLEVLERLVGAARD